MKASPALIIFARAPIPGEAKTRLIPALGPHGAAELYRRFLLDTLAQVSQVPATIFVAAAEPGHVQALRDLVSAPCPGAGFVVQSGADLGERMANAVRDVLALGHSCAVVIGSDSPTLPLARVNQALDLSAGSDLVLGPCFDGGYYLIGLRALIPDLFQGIEWSSPTVLVDTLRRAKAAGASVSLLEPWYDVDAPDGLALLRTHLTACSLAGQKVPCPLTWQYLCEPLTEA